MQERAAASGREFQTHKKNIPETMSEDLEENKQRRLQITNVWGRTGREGKKKERKKTNPGSGAVLKCRCAEKPALKCLIVKMKGFLKKIKGKQAGTSTGLILGSLLQRDR